MASTADPAVLERYRDYLALLARLHLPPHLRGKFGASDIVQQTMLKAAQSLGQYRGQTDEELAAWLRRILSNTVIDAAREFAGRKRDVGLERSLEQTLGESSARLEALLQAPPTSPSGQAVRNEQLQRLAGALARLSEEQRDAVELHYLQACTVAEVAAAMGRTERSVAGLVRRGLQKLRELLADEKD